MILISLLLATAPAPTLRPEVRRREAIPARDVRAARSKRMIELEAAVQSLLPAAEPPTRRGEPTGL